MHYMYTYALHALHASLETPRPTQSTPGLRLGPGAPHPPKYIDNLHYMHAYALYALH